MREEVRSGNDDEGVDFNDVRVYDFDKAYDHQRAQCNQHHDENHNECVGELKSVGFVILVLISSSLCNLSGKHIFQCSDSDIECQD